MTDACATAFAEVTRGPGSLMIRYFQLHVVPNFRQFRYDEPFLSYGPIFAKVHRTTANNLDICKVKHTNMHATYTTEAQLFVRFPLRWGVFELWPSFWKSAPNNPKWPWHVQGQKYQHACYIPPEAQISVTFALRWAVLEEIEIFLNFPFVTMYKLNY